jgi:hypothetical protein
MILNHMVYQNNSWLVVEPYPSEEYVLGSWDDYVQWKQ